MASKENTKRKVNTRDKVEVNKNTSKPKKAVVETTEVSPEVVEKPKKGIFKRIFDIVFWVLIIGLAIIWVVDFVNVKQNKEPRFCVKTVIHQYSDGTVKECVGLGYHVYNYDRTSTNLKTQFSPFFIGIQD